jgi:thiamine-phosphate pyrophosphorylase
MDELSLRVIDANLNRAAEALRVLEEYARLILDDAGLTGRLKSIRHRLAKAVSESGLTGCLAARDIQHDVGTQIETPTETRREDSRAVAAAAAKRAGQALRCLEEYGKIDHGAFAASVEQLRYEVYAVEQETLFISPRRQRLAAARLHVLVTESLCTRPWLEVCRLALEGGADVIQLREKKLPDRDLLARARQLRQLTAASGALLIINDRADIARLANADGVHLGQKDLSVSDARGVAGHTLLVGKSTHGRDEIEAAMREKPDYIAVGPMFRSSTKPDVPVQGPSLAADASHLSDLPIVAIGGINPENIVEFDVPGPIQFAVSSCIIGSEDPQAAARAMREAIDAMQASAV